VYGLWTSEICLLLKKRTGGLDLKGGGGEKNFGKLTEGRAVGQGSRYVGQGRDFILGRKEKKEAR